MPYYYYEDDSHRTVGPVSDGAVFQLIRDGVLTVDSRVMAERGGGWQTVRTLVERQHIERHAGARLALPAQRLGAWFLDLFIPCASVFALGGFALSGMRGIRPIATVALLAYAVCAALLLSNGQTPGKWLLGIRVINRDGEPTGFFRMLIREWIGKPISQLVFGLGYLWILIDRNNQGWHDKLFDTYVIED